MGICPSLLLENQYISPWSVEIVWGMFAMILESVSVEVRMDGVAVDYLKVLGELAKVGN